MRDTGARETSTDYSSHEEYMRSRRVKCGITGAVRKPYSHSGKTASSDDQTLMARLDELELAEAAAEAAGQEPILQGTKPNQAYNPNQATSEQATTAALPRPAVPTGLPVAEGHKPKPRSSGLRAGFFNAAPRGKPSKTAAMANPVKETLELKSRGMTAAAGVTQGSESTQSVSTPPPAGEPLKASGVAAGTVWVQERGPNPTAGSGRGVADDKSRGGQGSGDAKGFGCFAGDGGWQDFTAELGLSGREGGEGEEAGGVLGSEARDGPHEHVIGLQGEQGQGGTGVAAEPPSTADGGGIKKGRKMSMFMQQRAQMKKNADM